MAAKGRDRLHGATYAVMPDRIEAGSYACAAAITGGDLELVGVKAADMRATIDALVEAGVAVAETNDGIRVSADGRLRPLTLSTAPYPGFATDMQAQFMAMLTVADGASLLTETIFAWPGLGSYITDALLVADMLAVLGGTVVVGVVFIGLNMFSDLLYRLVDPRVR